MIQLIRNRSAQAIPASLRGQALVKKEQELISMVQQARSVVPPKSFTFKSDYWGKAKKALKAESFGKCAYCEAPTDQVAHGDVEHFRPKSVYWWLAYCYDNYLFSCQICNQTYKSDKFPVPGTALAEPNLTTVLAGQLAIDPLTGRITQFLQQLSVEQAWLPNPYYTNPEPFFVWLADDQLFEVEIRPNPQHSQATQVHQEVENCFGLNRLELKRLRYQVFALFRAIKLASKQVHLLDASTATAVRQQQQAMKADHAPFAGMIRYFDGIL